MLYAGLMGYGVCMRAGWPLTPTLCCIQKIKEAPCYFLENSTLLCFPTLIKEGAFRAKPQHLTCLSVLPLTCFYAFFSLLLLHCLSAFISSLCTSWKHLHLSLLSLFCLHFYICSLPLFLSALSLRLSFCQ